MKKVMKWMMMAMAAIVLTVGFAACSSDDDDDNGGSSKQTYGELELNIKLSQDALSVADFTIKYLDESGTEQTEQITSTSYTKDIKFKSLPAKVKYTVSATVKENLPAKEKFDITITDTSKAGKVSGNGEYKGANLHLTSVTGKGVNKDKIADYITKVCNNWSNDVTISK